MYGQRRERDVGDLSISGGERGEMCVVLEVADKRVLMGNVHMVHYSYFSCSFFRSCVLGRHFAVQRECI